VRIRITRQGKKPPKSSISVKITWQGKKHLCVKFLKLINQLFIGHSKLLVLITRIDREVVSCQAVFNKKDNVFIFMCHTLYINIKMICSQYRKSLMLTK